MIHAPDWQTAIKLPVIGEENPDWKVTDLCRLLLQAADKCGPYCLKHGTAINLCLSGGLDSSLSLAMLRQRYPRTPIHAFTIAGGPDHPDAACAMQVAKQFGAAHTVFFPSSYDINEAAKACRKLFKNTITDGIKVAYLITDGIKGTYLIYRMMSALGVKKVIAHDGIDELLGGYWEHRDHELTPQRRRVAFEYSWKRLLPDHLKPLHVMAMHFGVEVIHPYLDPDVVAYISGLALNKRTSSDRSKIPLRDLGIIYELPEEVLNRNKRGLCDALCKE